MTAAAQLDLFADVDAQPVVARYADTVCTGCGAVCRIPLDDDRSGSWNEAVLFGYAAIKAHEEEGCPGATPMAKAARRRLMNVWPVHEHVVPGTVRYADLVTSTWDARAALMLALGRTLGSGHA